MRLYMGIEGTTDIKRLLLWNIPKPLYICDTFYSNLIYDKSHSVPKSLILLADVTRK
jgi:hypothetical protein